MTDIILKQGTGVPSDSDLEVAEVAIDSSSGAMYTKLADGSVKHLNPKGGSASGGLSGEWEYSNSASAGKFTSRNQDWYTATTLSFHNTDAGGGKHTLALVSEGDVIVLGSADGLSGAEYRVLSVAPNLDVYTFTVDPISFFGQFFSDGEMVNADFVPQLGVGTVEEAPDDGKLYGRQSEAWAEITSTGGGSGGSIADGDTEGQITTWNGSEWTPEGAVVVKDSSVGIGTDSPRGKAGIKETDTNAVLADLVPSIVLTNQAGSYSEGLYHSGIAFSKANSNGATHGATIASVMDDRGYTSALAFGTAQGAGGVVTERMRIDANGNVGIGTASPSRAFVVSNNGGDGIELDYGSGSSFVQSYNRATSSFLPLDLYASEIHFHSGSSASERMRIDSSGNVGIGTTSPANILNLNDNTESGHDLAINRNTTYGANTGMGGVSWYDQAGSNVLARINAGTNGNATSSRISFDVSSSGVKSEAMRIDSSGNVGIGTTSPSDLLEVSSTSPAILITRTGGPDTYRIKQNAGKTSIQASGGIAWQVGSSGTDDVAIDSSGNVGIGTTSPSNYGRFVVQGAGGSNSGRLVLDGYASSGYTCKIGPNDDGIGYYSNNNTMGHVFYTGTAGTERMRIDANGNVGIGVDTTSYSNKLVVDQGGNYAGAHETAAILVRDSTGTISDGSHHGAISFSKGTGQASISAVQTGSSVNSLGLAFWTHASDTGTYPAIERMRIDSSGRVGIGGTPGTRSTKEIEDQAESTLANWKSQLDERLKAEPKADKKAVTQEITGHDKMPTKAELVERLTERTIGGGDAKLQVAGDGYFSGTIYGKVADVPDHVKNITPTQIANWDAGTGGGGGATTDGRISDTQIVNWDSAYGWGNHASAGYQPAGNYLTPSSLTGYATESWVNSQGFAKGSFVPTSGNSTISGTLTATDFVATSDERLKQNATTAPVGLVDQLRGVEFEWKEDGRQDAGVIAQEVEKVLPHLVHDTGEHKAVNYNGLVAYLIEEIKDLKAQVEALK